MSSDAFADLSKSLSQFAEALRNVLVANEMPTSASPARQEWHGEPFAGKWGTHPARGLFATMLLTSWSCAEHLQGLGILLGERRGIPAMYTLARAAAEAAATGCYLSEVGIVPLERVRRDINCNLEALTEDLNMLRRYSSAEALARIGRHEARIDAIGRGGTERGFKFTPPSGHRHGYLGDRPPSAMKMIDQCASSTPTLGAVSQQLLSSVAHGKLHGLSRFLVRVGDPAGGKVRVEFNVTAKQLAVELMVAPLCASTLARHLGWFLGWDVDAAEAASFRMQHAWGRIAGVPMA